VNGATACVAVITLVIVVSGDDETCDVHEAEATAIDAGSAVKVALIGHRD
jgi:hypothetical protein